jgi:hypothetical protein
MSAGFSPKERDHYRVLWRDLAARSIAAAAQPEHTPADLKALTATVTDWSLPVTGYDDSWAFNYLAQSAKCWSRQGTIRRRAALAPALRIVAELVGDMLDGVEGKSPPPEPAPSPPPPPELPFRADIDG